MYNNNQTDAGAVLIGVIGVLLAVVIVFCSSTAKAENRWNNGVCPKCGVRYNLVAVDHYGDYHVTIKYYACPECGAEVKR